MARRPIDPEKRLEIVAVRLEPAYVGALDLIAYGLSARSAKPVTRSAALRFVLKPVVGALVARVEILETLRETRREALVLARRGSVLAREGLTHRQALARTAPIIRALGSTKAVQQITGPKHPSKSKRGKPR